jgi:hypothetical protein
MIAPAISRQPVAALPAEGLARLLPPALFAFVLAVAILTVTPWPVGAFQDDAIYTVLARSLAEGEGYRMINLPGAPHATHYPPVYPAVLALLWRLGPPFPDNIVVFKFANAVFLAAAALGTFVFARARLGWTPWGAAAAALAGALSILVLLITGVVLSEPLFMALLLPALLLAERSAETGRVGTAVLAGAALGVLALTRTLGAVAVPAAVVMLLVRRRPLAAVALGAAALAFLLPWQLWVSAYQHEIPPVLTGKYGAYGSWLADGYREGGLAFARGVFIANLQSLDRLLSYAFMPVQTVWPRAVAFITISALAVGGLVALARRAPVTVGFIVCYGGVIMLWPFEPDRFVLAIWPLVAILVGAAITAVWRWRPAALAARMARVGALGLTLAALAGFAVYNARGYRGQWWTSVQRDAGRRAKPIAEWVVRHTAPSDVLSTDDDLIVFLYTGRQAVPTSTFLARERLRPLTADEDAAAVRAILGIYRPRYYITGSRAGVRTADAMSAGTPPLLRRAGETTSALVYEYLAR